MTSELRPAVEVASAVYDECREKGIRDGGALIKADREAVRTEQAAELARLKSLSSDHFRNATRLARELAAANDKAAKYKALAETLAEALGQIAPHVNWMPHPHCLTVEQIIRAALGETK